MGGVRKVDCNDLILKLLLLQTRPEEEVGFEEHVLLDHLIADGFPKKGETLHPKYVTH